MFPWKKWAMDTAIIDINYTVFYSSTTTTTTTAVACGPALGISHHLGPGPISPAVLMWGQTSSCQPPGCSARFFLVYHASFCLVLSKKRAYLTTLGAGLGGACRIHLHYCWKISPSKRLLSYLLAPDGSWRWQMWILVMAVAVVLRLCTKSASQVH